MKSRAQDDASLGERFVGCVKWMCRVPGDGSSSGGEQGVLGLAGVWGSLCQSVRSETPTQGGKRHGFFCSC